MRPSSFSADDSLRLYLRFGTQESVRWVDAAEQARVDTLQQTNVPAVDSCEAFGALLHDNKRDVVARENAIRNLLGTQPAGPQRGKKRREPGEADPEENGNASSSAPQRGKRQRAPCEDDPEEDEDALQPPPSDTSPLTTANAQGRWVLVPRAAWPEYPCTERNGAGWEAVIGKVVRGVARVHFLYNMTPRGIPYADVDLALSALSPL